ncbi:MAG: hypothetical protein ACRDRS_24005 [Pseudonocardiaceae bacterium]
MEPVPRLSSNPAASCLASADRPWRLTPSSRPDRCPQHPYYRFYYGRPRIVADNSARLPPLGVPVAVLWEQPLMILHAGARAASRRPGGARPRGDPGAVLDATGEGLG